MRKHRLRLAWRPLRDPQRHSSQVLLVHPSCHQSGNKIEEAQGVTTPVSSLDCLFLALATDRFADDPPSAGCYRLGTWHLRTVRKRHMTRKELRKTVRELFAFFPFSLFSLVLDSCIQNYELYEQLRASTNPCSS
jgi:hypothetical protein